jgi:hypothetical protein
MPAADSRNQFSNTTAEPASKPPSDEQKEASRRIEKSVERTLNMVASIPQEKRSAETTVEERLAVSAQVS